MAGFGIDGVAGRIACPHCGSNDCAGIGWPDRARHGNPLYAVLVCVKTSKYVTAEMLRSTKEAGA